MDSIWDNDVTMPRFPQLEGDLRTDVLVIGGGLAGLLCAWNLTRVGVDCALIEENRIMSGVSGRTTAKVTAQHGLVYGKLLRKFGPEKAKLYWQANRDAVAALGKLAQEADCDYESQSNSIYTRDATGKLEEEMAAYERLGIPARWRKELPLPFPVSGALEFPDQGQFHPLKLASPLARDLPIYENTIPHSSLGSFRGSVGRAIGC